MLFNEHFLRGVMPSVSIISDAFPEDARFSIDSRTLQPGELFVALKGERVDGHNFISEALKEGAAGIILGHEQRELLAQCEKKLLKNKLIVTVPDPLDALYALAKAWRAQFDYPVVAITGSVGKTTTKEMIAAIMHVQGKNCLISHGNQNTKLGIALTMLQMRTHHEYAIMEVGINCRGEMEGIAEMLRPTYGVITCIGHSHMEGLGSLHDIATEKRLLFKYFSEENVGIINGDQTLLSQVSYAHPTVKFGFKSTNQVQVRKITMHDDHISCIIKLYRKKYSISFPQVHMGILMNSLAASSVAYLLGVDESIIIETLKKPFMITGRFESRTLKNNRGVLIHDAYNANPESMKVALATFEHIKSSAKRILVIGDMLELGTNSPFWHRQLGRVLRKLSATHEIVLVGELVQWALKGLPVGAHVHAVLTWQEALPIIERKIHDYSDSMILLKGSNGIGLANLADALTEPTYVPISQVRIHEQTSV